MAPEIDTVVTPRPEQFRYTAAIPALTEKNARLARRSFEAFRRTIRPDMLWNPFVLRLTRELERFGGDTDTSFAKPYGSVCSPGSNGAGAACICSIKPEPVHSDV
jgi:hypothetical protein